MHDDSSRVNDDGALRFSWNWDEVSAADFQCRLTDLSGQHWWCRLNELNWRDVVRSRPARTFHAYRGRRHYSGYHYSATTKSLVPVESRHEAAFVTVADANPEIVAICGQPFMLQGSQDGKTVTRFPDFLTVENSGRVEIVDVTTPARAKHLKAAAAFAWTRQAFELRAWSYQIWEGADPLLLQNLHYASVHRRRDRIDEETLTAIHAELASSPLGHSIRDLLCVVKQERRVYVIPAIMHLVWSGKASLNWYEPLSQSTNVCLSAELNSSEVVS